MTIEKYLELAMSAAHEAGDYALNVQKEELIIHTKSNEMDLVTQVDKHNEDLIRDRVLSTYSDHMCLGEERGGSVDECDVRWVIDPIDGTVNFAHGLPIWCVSIGVEVKGTVECGVIYNPNLKETFTAIRGQGAFLNGKRIQVSQVADASKSLFVTGFPYHVDKNPGRVIEQFCAFLSKGLLVRRLGSAALDLAYVACGRFEGFWEAYLSPWDTAAGQLLVREAGGRVTHYSGEDYNIHTKSIIATNGLHHQMILDVIEESNRKFDNAPSNS
jgi:myo-inositol-1(or 4)-monophosphatase